MNDRRLATIIRSACAPEVILKRKIRGDPGKNTEHNNPKTGTTVLAFFYNGGIMLAADAQMTLGYSTISSFRIEKILELDEKTGVLICGSLGDIQVAFDNLYSTNKYWMSQYGYYLSFDGKVNFLSNFLRDNFLIADFIIAGYDHDNEECRICQVHMSGCVQENYYETAGSGSENADGVLLEYRSKIRNQELDEDESINIGLKALGLAGRKDPFTGHPESVYPTFATVTRKGLDFVKEKKIKQFTNKYVREERKKDGR